MISKKWKISGTLILSCLLFVLPFSVGARTAPLKDFDHPRLVEPTELAGILQHPDVRIVDMRSSLTDYLQGHIPNSVYLHFENLRVPQEGVPGQAPDRICLERLMGDGLSLSNDMWCIIYSERSNGNATFLAWALDFLGHKKVGILNGGWERWVSEKLPTTQDYPAIKAKKFFGKAIRETLAEKQVLKEWISAKGWVTVDARSHRQYSGEEGEEIRRGHLPGAKNVYWDATLEGDEFRVWKKKEDLEKLFLEAGVTKDKQIVVICSGGREGSHLYFTLKHVLGYPRVRLYRGSWIEWSADKKLPVKTGTDP
jgi:thiosulfate/3-mercaptopyruvate sulfurtransferase